MYDLISESEERGNNPQKIGKFSWEKTSRYLELYRQLESENFSDSLIAAWDENGEKIMFKVHKAMIQAASKVLTAQLSSRWETGEEGIETIVEIPQNFSVQAVKVFIKLLYVDTLDPDISLETALQIAYICDMLIIEDAIETCNNFVLAKITTETCITIFENYEKLQTGNCSIVCNKALEFVARNLNILLEDSRSENWTKSIWQTVLGLESPEVVVMDEMNIFLKLKSWRDANLKEREEDFQKVLLPLIRFPLISRTVLVDEVIPLEVLSDKDVSDLLSYALQGGGRRSNGQRQPRFNRFSRTVKVISTFQELYKCESNDNILLSPGTFKGLFSFTCDKIKITGMGPETKIFCNGNKRSIHSEKCILVLRTSDSEISNLDFHCNCVISPTPENEKDTSSAIFGILGSRNHVTKLNLIRTKLWIEGNFNVVTDSSFRFADCGISFGTGNRNTFRNLAITKTKYGFCCTGEMNYNILEKIVLKDVLHGIYIPDSTGNKLSEITYEYSGKWSRRILKPKGGFRPDVILLDGGFENTISEVIGYPSKNCKRKYKEDGIIIEGEGKSNRISNINLSGFTCAVWFGIKNSGNSVQNVKTKDTMLPLLVRSDDNFGSNIVCEYTTEYLQACIRGAAYKAIAINGGSNNIFDGVEVIVPGVHDLGEIVTENEEEETSIESDNIVDEGSNLDNTDILSEEESNDIIDMDVEYESLPEDNDQKERQSLVASIRILEEEENERVPRSNEIFFLGKQKAVLIEGENNHVYFNNAD